MGIATYFILPSSISRANFLNEEERAQLLSLRRSDAGESQSDEAFHWADAKEGMRDWQ